MPHRPLMFGSLFGLAVLVAPGFAHASNSHQARVLYQKGNNAFKYGDSILARDYYRKSLALEESFDTLCNLGRAEEHDKLFKDSYEHLAYCVELYPTDPELADARQKFVELKNDVRSRLSSEDAGSIDESVAAEMKRREDEAEAKVVAPTSGLEESAGARASEPKKSSARVPVALGLGVAGVAGLSVGGIFLGKAGGHKKDADALRADLESDDEFCVGGAPDARCAELKEDSKKVDSSRMIGGVGLIAGGALVTGAVLTYLLWPDQRTKSVNGAPPTISHVRPNFQVGPDSWGLSLGGSF